MNHIFRLPKAKRKGSVMMTALDAHLAQRKLEIAVDRDKAIVDEWCRTCGTETIKALLIHWEQWSAVAFVEPVAVLPSPHRQKLRKMGFGENTIDKVVLRTALATGDKLIVSEDSDFWDPADKKSVGDQQSSVCKYLRGSMSITLLHLPGLLRKLASW